MFDPCWPVLVVDDYPMVAATILGLLRAEGFRNVDVAHNGARALEMLATKGHRVVVSDYRMPGMNGVELFRAVRQSRSSTETPFVMITAYKDAEVLNEVSNAGVDALLTKPFSPELLSSTIKDVVTAKSAARCPSSGACAT